MGDYLRVVLAITGKDLRAEIRGKEMLSAMLIFALLVAVIFSFAFNVESGILRETFPGVVWVAFFFAGTLGLNRSFVGERTNAAIHGLMLAPSDRSAIYFGKVLGNLAIMFVTELVGLPIFLIFFDASVQGSWFYLLASLVTSTFGFIAVGTFLAALSANTRTSEILLPIILFPVMVPVVLGAVQTTAGAMADPSALADPTGYLNWFKVLLVYDAVFLVVPFLLFDYVLEV